MNNEDNTEMIPESCSIDELMAIAGSPENYSVETLLVVHDELIRRGELEPAQKLKQYITGNESAAGELTESEIVKIYAERLVNGEPVESIKQDFEEMGIDLSAILNKNAPEAVRKHSAAAAREQLMNEDIQHSAAKSATRKKAERNRLSQRGTENLVAGLGILVLSFFGVKKAFATGEAVTFMVLLMISAGGWMIVRGITQLNKSKREE